MSVSKIDPFMEKLLLNLVNGDPFSEKAIAYLISSGLEY